MPEDQQKFVLRYSPVRGGEDELSVNSRSMLQIMSAFASYVQVPEAHLRDHSAAVFPEDGVLLELGRHEFDLLAQRDPQLLSHFLRRAIMRVVYNEQGLIARLRRRNQELQMALDTLRATTHRLNQTEVLTRTDELARRLPSSAASSAFTMTCSKKASTGAFSAASACNEAV